MQTPLTLLKHQRIPTHCQHAHRPPPILHPRNLHHLRPRLTRLLHQIRHAQLILRKRLNVTNRFTTKTFAQELDLVAFDVFDDEDFELGEEVECEFGDGVAEDGFLDEEDVAPGGFDLLAQVEEVLTLFFEDFVHLAVVIYYDGVIHLRGNVNVNYKGSRKRFTYIRFGGAELELNETDLRLFDSCRTPTRDDDVLVQDDAIDEFSVFNCSANFLHYADVAQIDV